MLSVSAGAAMAAPAIILNIRGGVVGGRGEAPPLDNPRGIAVAAMQRRVYVAEDGTNRISVYSPEGAFRWAFGDGARDRRLGRLQRCSHACSTGSKGVAPGQFEGPRGIALDRRGDIYVVDEENFRVQKFTSAGRFVWMIGGGVNHASEGNLCTRPERASCGKGTQGSGAGEFRDWDAGNFIAVDPAGRVLVGDKGRIEVFAPDGRFETQIGVPRQKNVGSLGVEPRTGDIYYAYSQFWTNDAHVYKLSPGGHEICSARVPGPTTLAAAEGGGAYVASDSINAETGESEQEIVQLSSDCRVIRKFGRQPVGTALNSLASGLGRLYAGTYEFEVPKSSIAGYPTPRERGLQRISPFELLRFALAWLARFVPESMLNT
jgi:DNA-binding beta-propeller fold protein YncE